MRSVWSGACALCLALGVACRPITARMASRLEDPRAPVVTATAPDATSLRAGFPQLSEPRRILLEHAMQRLGQPAAGFDCSSFAQSAFAAAGIDVPRTVREQLAVGMPVGSGEPVPGDLLFFAFGHGLADHVGIYAGSGAFLHVSSAAARVQLATLADPAFAAAYVGPRSFVPDAEPAP